MFRKITSNTSPDFKTEIPEYPDEKIIEILKQRDHYLPVAAKLVIDEAIKRGIIFSEQDLFAEEYNVEPIQFSMIPRIVKSNNKDKIRKSIARSLVVCGVMPLVYGFVKLNSGSTIEGGLILLIGLAWIFSSSQLIRAYQKIFVFVLMAVSSISLAYILHKLILAKGHVVMDFFIPLSLFALILYGLIFIIRSSER